MDRQKKPKPAPFTVYPGDEIIDMGLVGSIQVEGADHSGLLQEIAQDAELEALLDYVPSEGLLRHREVAADWVRQYGLAAEPDRIVICAGALHAINCCLWGLFQPGDRIAVDELTFTGFKNAARLSHMKLEPVAMDAEGMIPESLEHCCATNAIKGLYLMPNMQNPTATVMSAERKQAIAAIILRYGLILIEDDIYHDTNLMDQTALSTLVPEQGIYICGISKAFYPGLRIAYTLVPERFLHAFTQTVTNTVWMAPALSAELVSRIIASGRAADMLAKKRQALTVRVKLAREILRGFSYQITDNGMFLWLTLPEGWTCADFESTALIHKIRVISASKFYVGSQQPPDAVRVSLCSVRDEAQLIRGLEGLVRILKQNPLLTSPVM